MTSGIITMTASLPLLPKLNTHLYRQVALTLHHGDEGATEISLCHTHTDVNSGVDGAGLPFNLH